MPQHTEQEWWWSSSVWAGKLNAGAPAFSFQLCPWLAVWPWTDFFTSQLCPSSAVISVKCCEWKTPRYCWVFAGRQWTDYCWDPRHECRYNRTGNIPVTKATKCVSSEDYFYLFEILPNDKRLGWICCVAGCSSCKWIYSVIYGEVQPKGTEKTWF